MKSRAFDFVRHDTSQFITRSNAAKMTLNDSTAPTALMPDFGSNPGPALMATTIVFVVLCTLLVGLRSFVRIKLVKTWGIDDTLLVAALAIFVMEAASTLISIHYGLGKHFYNVPVENLILSNKWQVIAKIVYVANAAIVKLSVGTLLLRVSNKAIYKYIICCIMSTMTGWAIYTFFVILFQCSPVYLSWSRMGPPPYAGTCLSNFIIINSMYAFSAIDIFCDWAFSLLPIPMLWHAQLSRPVKCSVILVLGLGCVASTACIIRLVYIVRLVRAVQKSHQTYLMVPSLNWIVVRWTVVELGLTITAASIAAMRPLAQHLNIRGFTIARNSPANKLGAGSDNTVRAVLRSGNMKTSGCSMEKDSIDSYVDKSEVFHEEMDQE